MSDIYRYDKIATMTPDDEGDWCLWSEVETLVEEHQKLKQEHRLAVQQLREVSQKLEVLQHVPEDDPNRLERLESWLHSREMHPDFEYETTEGPRKSWDNQHIPPEGVGWERNNEYRDGWERFDYHEESYWRRRKPTE